MLRSLVCAPSFPNKPHLVISSYKEDMTFLQQYDFPMTIYNKAGNDSYIQLPNLGKCDHTYLYYILSHYDTLPDLICFLPASFHAIPKKRTLTHQLLYSTWMNQQAMIVGDKLNHVCKQNYDFQLTEWNSSLDKNQGSIKMELSEIRPFGKWYESVFGDMTCQIISWFGIFSVRREDILAHPKSFYEKLFQMLLTPNPEAGHYLERSWSSIFPSCGLVENKM
jgi:hypothetical protein